MNRLTAAKRIRNGLDVSLPKGGAVHFDCNWREDEYGRSTFHIFRADTYINRVPPRTDWEPISWRETLRFIRESFLRRNGEECKFIHDAEDEDGEPLDVHCTISQEHFHCKKCEEVETGVGIYRLLCERCSKESDQVRRDLTMKMSHYEHTFGITFHWDEELLEHFAWAEREDNKRHHEKQEDFHADG